MSAAGGRGRRVDPAAWRPAGIDKLEAAAWEAMRRTGSTVVAAGPGSGKTELLAQRAAYLLQTGLCPPPQKILAISFKRDAAKNLAHRVEKRVPDHRGRFVSLTFDAFTKGLIDRFGAALPAPWTTPPGSYDLGFWKDRETADLLDGLQAAATPERRHAFSRLSPARFMPDQLGLWPLPEVIDEDQIPTADYPVYAWWRQFLLDSGRAQVNFTMLNRLAELLLRSNPKIRRALLLTYPYVFIDEFQDTTGAQVTLLETLFENTDTVLTAVGDRKQRIMRFAGALEDSMARFQSRFDADLIELRANFRSSADLVTLQHVFAQQLDPTAEPATSHAAVESGHTAAEIWHFPTAAAQAAGIADWIAEDIAASTRTAADFAFVAKQKVRDIEQRLSAELARNEIVLRNDDTPYGPEMVPLQEILKHDATTLLLGLLRLSLTPTGLGTVWAETLALLGEIQGTDRDEAAARAAADRLARDSRELRSWLERNPPGMVTAEALLTRTQRFLAPGALQAHLAGQHGARSVDEVLAGLADRIDQVAATRTDWGEVLTATAADDAVTLMTIHRSKGLEYHTVFVIGLDDDQWWSWSRDPEEGMSTFFVGLSRAAQRIIFTRDSRNARGRNTIQLYQLLGDAGVAEIEMS